MLKLSMLLLAVSMAIPGIVEAQSCEEQCRRSLSERGYQTNTSRYAGHLDKCVKHCRKTSAANTDSPCAKKCNVEVSAQGNRPGSPDYSKLYEACVKKCTRGN
jgi:hypothetical protein